MTQPFSFFDHLFGGKSSASSKARKRLGNRLCRIEELESRDMLSVSPWSGIDNDVFNPNASNSAYVEFMPTGIVAASSQIVSENSQVVYDILIAAGFEVVDDTNLVKNGFSLDANGHINYIKISENKNLEDTLNISGLEMLSGLTINGTNLKALTVSNCASLTTLIINGNQQLTTLTVSNNVGLFTLNADDNSLARIFHTL